MLIAVIRQRRVDAQVVVRSPNLTSLRSFCMHGPNFVMCWVPELSDNRKGEVALVAQDKIECRSAGSNFPARPKVRLMKQRAISNSGGKV